MCILYIKCKKEIWKFYLLENKKKFNNCKICKKEGNLEFSMILLRKCILIL